MSKQFPYCAGLLYLHVNCHRVTVKLWIPVASAVFVFSLLLIARCSVISASLMASLSLAVTGAGESAAVACLAVSQSSGQS